MTSRSAVFFIFALAYFLSYFYRSANAVIAPDLAREMALSAAELGLMTSLFYAAFAAVQIPLGLGLDRFGPRFVTPALMLAGVAGSLIFAGAHSFAALALGRALIGVGMAGILMGALKAFSQWFRPARYSTVSGLLIGLGSAGALVAATPLAWLNAAVGWRMVFVLGAGAIALVALAIVVGTRNTPPGVPWPVRRTDLRVLGQVFADLRFWRIALLVFFTNGVLLAFQGLWAGPYVDDLYGVDALQRGNLLLLLSLGATAGYLTSGWLADRFGLVRVVILGAMGLIVALTVLALQPPLAVMAIAGILFGVTGGFGAMLLAQPRLVFPLAITGQATTAVNVFAIGGTFLLQWWMGLIIGAFPVDAAGHYPPAAYSAALATTAAGTLAALLFYLPLRRAGAAK
jgi:nitrate/nitrite transporter NarK